MQKILLSIVLGLIGFVHCYAEPLWALTACNRVLRFDSDKPGTTAGILPVTGLQGNEDILAIDFRPRTGGLYALTTLGAIYSINKETGAATIEGALSTPLRGSSFGFDFNPVTDRIRITSNTDQNLRYDPPTDGTTPDANLAYAANDPHAKATPAVAGSAHNNNFSGATATILYDLDSTGDRLLIQEPPDNGILKTIGTTGADVTPLSGFDISGTTGVAYMSGLGQLFIVNLATGVATAIGAISDAGTLAGENIIDIAAPTAPQRPKLLNISTRGQVGEDQNVLIAGFITRGGTLGSAFLIRGIGPSLESAGISSPLADPELTLYDSNGAQLATNNNWKDSQESTIQLTGLAPSNDLESAIFVLLPEGTYTVVLFSHVSGSEGIALVEIYYL